MTLLPPFIAAHAISRVLYAISGNETFEPNGYTILYQILCVTWMMLLALTAMILADDLVSERGISGAATAAGVVVYWVGTNFAYYFFREPLMSHLAGASWIIISVWALERLLRGTPLPYAPRRATLLWFLAGFAISMAIAVRPTNAFMWPIAVYGALSLWRQGRLAEAARSLPVMVLAQAPLAVQMMVWRALAGRAVVVDAPSAGYRPFEVFHWAHPALLQTLFSDHHGLFIWSPLLLLAVAGLVWHLLVRRQCDGLLIAWCAAGVCLWYVNSSWYAWSFGDAFGGRAFVELAGLFVIGMALAFQWIASAGKWLRGAVYGGVGLAIVFNWTLAALYILHRIPRHGGFR
jgi:hypothetical protein